MRVTNVSVSYGRERQPAKYESSEARVGFDASLSDNENYVTVAKQLLGDAKTLVLTEVGIIGAGENASAFARTAEGTTVNVTNQVTGQQTPSEGEKTETGRKARTPAAAKDKATDQKPVVGDDDGTGLGPTAPAKTAVVAEAPKAPAKTDDGTGMPGKAAVAAAVAGKELTSGDVQGHITDLVAKKQILPVAVKTLLTTKFQVSRLVDLKPEQLQAFKDAIDAEANAV